MTYNRYNPKNTHHTIKRISTLSEGGDEGYEIIFHNGDSLVLCMDMSSGCCEQPGYFMSEDNLADFLGANVLNVEVVNTALRVYDVEEYLHASKDSTSGVMFVNLTTDRGVLQFVAYNYHNGYYGHDAEVYWMTKQMFHTETL